MAHPPRDRMNRGDRVQLAAVLIAMLFIMVMGVLVVAYPKTFGLPGLGASATPAATVEATAGE